MKDCCYVIETFDHGYISKVVSLELDNFTFDTTKSIIKAFKWDNPNKAIEYCNKYNNDKEPVYYFGFSKLADYYHLNNYKNYDDVTETTEGIMLYHNNMDVIFSNGSYKGLNPLMNKDIFTTQIIWEDRDSKLLKFYPKR